MMSRVSIAGQTSGPFWANGLRLVDSMGFIPSGLNYDFIYEQDVISGAPPESA